MNWFGWLIIGLFVGVFVSSYYHLAVDGGCGWRGPFNPKHHEFCKCGDEYFKPVFSNCFDCEAVCATLWSYRRNMI